MNVYNIEQIAKDLAAMNMMSCGTFNDQSTVGVFKFSTETGPWERHSTSDEFLYLLSGDLSFEILLDSGAVTKKLVPGSLFIMPKNVWHRATATQAGAVLFIVADIEHSTADDPRE